MVGLLERAHDGILIVKTDRRLWAAGGFLGCVLALWLATGSWREAPPEPERHAFVPRQPEDEMAGPIRSMASALEERKKNREELHDTINRAANDFETGKQELDWHVNNLVDRLNTMGERIDKLAKDVGDRAVEKAELDKKIKPAKKKRGNVYKPVSRSDP